MQLFKAAWNIVHNLQNSENDPAALQRFNETKIYQLKRDFV